MYIVPTVLFIAGIAAGGCYGFVMELPLWNKAVWLAIGGFAGSAAGGIAVLIFYFTSPEEAEPAQPLPEHHRLTQPEALALENKGDSVSESAPPQKTLVEETDKQKIKRLKKEIRALKKKRSDRS